MSDKVRIPRTKTECFEILDEMLSQEDKQAIAQMENTIDLHFSLGMWIRNNWIYPQSQEDVETLLKQFDDSGDLNGMVIYQSSKNKEDYIVYREMGKIEHYEDIPRFFKWNMSHWSDDIRTPQYPLSLL